MIDQSNRAGKSGFSKFTLHPCFRVFSFNLIILQILVFFFFDKITTDVGLKMSPPRSLFIGRFFICLVYILTTQSRNLSEYCVATNTNRLELSVCGLRTAPCDGDPRHSLTPSSFLFGESQFLAVRCKNRSASIGTHSLSSHFICCVGFLVYFILIFLLYNTIWEFWFPSWGLQSASSRAGPFLAPAASVPPSCRLSLRYFMLEFPCVVRSR